MRLLILVSAFFVSAPLFAQSYFIRFPDDVFVQDCDGSFYFGEPQLYNPDSLPLVVSYYNQIIDVVPDACYRIERSWTIYNPATYDPAKPCINVPNPTPVAILNHPSNWPGPVVSSISAPGDPWSASIVKITPGDPAPTNFSVFWSANPNCYNYVQSIKIFDSTIPVLSNCLADGSSFADTTQNDPYLWNAPYWWDAPAGSSDMREGPVDLSISAYDSCTGLNLNSYFQLFLDLDQDEYFETVVDSRKPQTPGVVYFGNFNTPGYTGGTPRYFDQRPGVDSLRRFRFALERVLNTNPAVFRLRWAEGKYPDTVVYSTPQLPPGLHAIRWYVGDGCGNETLCKYNFTMLGGVVPSTEQVTSALSLQAAPNPFREKTSLTFNLVAAENARLRVWNTSGKLVLEKTIELPAGEQAIPVSKTELGSMSGVFWYSLQTASGNVSGKLILLP